MTDTTSINNSPASNRRPCILSLDELEIQITDEVYDYLAAPFRTEDNHQTTTTIASSTTTDDDDDDNNCDTSNIAIDRMTIQQQRLLRRSSKSLNRILQRMKIPPKTTILRLTTWPKDEQRQQDNDVCLLQQIQVAMEEWIQQQQQQQLACQVKFHPIVSNVISIDIINVSSSATTISQETTEAISSSLYSKRVPHPPPPLCTTTTPTSSPLHNGDNDTTTAAAAPSSSSLSLLLFPEDKWPWRTKSGWPCTHYVVIVDRLCGEAVLRGSDIFVKGILVADANILAGTSVAVYADLETRRKNKPTADKAVATKTTTTTTRGQHLQHYTGHAVFLGLGTAACSRALFFSQSHGLGVNMSALPWQRAGPVLPPFMDNNNNSNSNSNSNNNKSSSKTTTTTTTLAQLVASGRVHAQNLPSALVAHILDPQPGQVIFDMCGAPGGKTSHVAQLVLQQQTANNNNNMVNVEEKCSATTTIVMADKSRKKVLQARDLFQRLLAGADVAVCSVITPLHLDSTNCVEHRQDIPRQSVQEILSTAEPSPKDGLLQVTRFFPESFHRILLDPPCSALGLRPKFKIPQQTVQELKSLVNYQQCFVREAIHLLQVDGILTYSTCTVNYHENEGMVFHILNIYPCMELLPIPSNLGGRCGLRCSKELLDSVGGGLNEIESSYVRRFGCTDDPNDDTIGFFIAKFRKRYSMNVS